MRQERRSPSSRSKETMRRKGRGRALSGYSSLNFASGDSLVFPYSFVPAYFEPDIDSGIAKLTEEGRTAVAEELTEGITKADGILVDSKPAADADRSEAVL